MISTQAPTDNYWASVATGKLLEPDQYDHIIYSYSGGKDSLAMVLHMLESDFPKTGAELWHQNVDGAPGILGLMDWHCTPGYVNASGHGLDIPVLYQWKDGGFEGEMLRENAPTKGVYFQTPDSDEPVYCPPTSRSKNSTRLKFPQVSADLQTRWCSSYVKIDVARRAIANDPRFDGKKILFVTGERREESANRSKYNAVEAHSLNNGKRLVHHWRPVIEWTEDYVWEIIQRWNIHPHPAYVLGFGRVSCQHCIFADKHQLASNKFLDPKRHKKIAAYERRFGSTIKRDAGVNELAKRGTEFVSQVPEDIRELAMSTDYPIDRFFLGHGEQWELPRGAFRSCGGPT